MPDLSEYIIWPEHASLHACMQCACVHRTLSQPNRVKSERSKYLWKQENIPDLSEHNIWPKHASLHACTLCPCMYRPIFQPNWVESERSKDLWNQDNMLDLSDHISPPSTLSSVHARYVLWCLGPYLIQIGLDQRDKGIYGIRRTCQTSMST